MLPVTFLRVSRPKRDTTPRRRGLTINVSLNAAGSLITSIQDNRTGALPSTGNGMVLPSIIRCRGSGVYINTGTCRSTTSSPRGAVVSMGHLVNHSLGSVRTHCPSLPCRFGRDSGKLPIVGAPRNSIGPMRMSTRVLGSLSGQTRTALKNSLRNIIVAMPTCFSSTRHTKAGSTTGLTNLAILHLLGRPATTTVTCKLSSNRRNIVTICSLNNNAFSVSVLHLSGNMFRMLTANNSSTLNNSSFSRMLTR